MRDERANSVGLDQSEIRSFADGVIPCAASVTLFGSHYYAFGTVASWDRRLTTMPYDMQRS